MSPLVSAAFRCCQQLEEGDPSPLLRPSETHLEYWVQFWSPCYKNRDILEQVWQAAMKVIKGYKHLAHEARQSKLGEFSLGMRRLQ